MRYKIFMVTRRGTKRPPHIYLYYISSILKMPSYFQAISIFILWMDEKHVDYIKSVEKGECVCFQLSRFFLRNEFWISENKL